MNNLPENKKEAEIQIKTCNMLIQAYAVASKNKRIIQGLERMNVLDEHTATDLGLGDLEVDKIKCPKQGIIIRQECLDFSGKAENYNEICADCENFETTRRALIPA